MVAGISEGNKTLRKDGITDPEEKYCGMMFEEWHPAFKPKILFDKENIIQFKPFKESELQKQTERLLIKQKDLVAWYGRRDVYIRRNNYIEATNYYIKFTFMSLVEVLRIKYTPRTPWLVKDTYFTQISLRILWFNSNNLCNFNRFKISRRIWRSHKSGSGMWLKKLRQK